jgi:hypothetical protein
VNAGSPNSTVKNPWQWHLLSGWVRRTSGNRRANRGTRKRVSEAPG